MKTTSIIVAVIVCMVLAVIILPKWQDMPGREKESQVRANVQQVQLMIEDYKVWHDGNKPAGLSEVQVPSIENPYNNKLKNADTLVYTKAASATPWNGKKGSNAGNRGMIEYAWNGNKKSPYIITGYGKDRVLVTIVEGK